MPNELIYQSEFSGQQMDERFRAVATLAEALTVLEQAIAAKYTKPASGIPSTDMDADVQAALAKANSAVQSLADYYTKSEVDQLLAAINGQEYVDVATLPTASASTMGKVYLLGPDASGYYAYYYASYDGSDYSWVGPLGTTEISLAKYATKAELSQLDQEVADMVQPSDYDFAVSDEAGFDIVRFSAGHIRTKNFDSQALAEASRTIGRYAGKKLSILGDSISTYGDPSATNENGTYCYSYYPAASCRYSEDGVDSIQFDVEDTYWMKLIRATGMVLGINDSYRGTKVSGTSNAFNLQTRIDHLDDNGTPDVILVFGGTNDAGGDVTVGTFNTENPANYTDEQIAALPVSTFADAYRTMLIRLMKTYPLAEIVVILPTFTSSYYTITNLDLYAEVIKEACDFFGIKYIDARVSGINIYNKSTYLADGIHPNAAGMELLFSKVYRQLIFG